MRESHDRNIDKTPHILAVFTQFNDKFDQTDNMLSKLAIFDCNIFCNFAAGEIML
jgi:hypothetical protein